MNLTRFLSYMKHAMIVMAMLTIVGISGCDDDDGPSVYNGTIMDLIADKQFKQAEGASADQALDSLNKYLTLYPTLVTTLSTGTDLTLFAPSNTAFINLLATPGFPADIRNINPAIVQSVLSYHIVSGKYLQSDLTSGTTLTTAYTNTVSADDKIIVNADGTLKTGSTNQAIVITTPDKRANNGVVHVTATVLIPQSTGASLTPILGTMAGTVLLGKDFTNLAKIIMFADQGFTENAGTGTFKVSTWLAMPITGTTVTANAKGFTFFAPPNAAGSTQVLTETAANTIIASGATNARNFLLNHLVTSGQYTVGDAPANNPNGITKFTDGVLLTPKTGAAKTIRVSVGTPSATNPYGVALSNVPADQTTYRPIVAKDLGHSNGQVQVFAGVLQ